MPSKDEKLYKCVYCLQDKPKSEFNKEHVNPKAFGTFVNNMTLSDQQVCKMCNTAFSAELESVIAEDSLEALSRITSGTQNFEDGYELHNTRIKIRGQDGVLKGLDFRVLTDKTNAENIKVIPYPAIGIKQTEMPMEYQYFVPDRFPVCSPEIINQLSGKEKPILYWNMAKSKVLALLKKKGYTIKAQANLSLDDLYEGEMLNFEINVIMDKKFNRLVAKTAFNYLVLQEGKEVALLKKFDPIRNFIRYDAIPEKIKITHAIGKVVGVDAQDGDHIIGLIWGDQSRKKILGIVSWFGEMVHTICLSDDSENVDRSLPMSVFSNTSRIITTERPELRFRIVIRSL